MNTFLKKPLVSVIMPVYNGEKYLKEAIESILCQTFSGFIFLIIDDGSTDNSVDIIRTYSDTRIILLRNEKNLGISATLNKGLDNTNTTYIARMDCDDISLPTRLEEQVQFMEAHRNIGACGTWIQTIRDNSGYTHKYLTNPEDIKASLLFNTSLAHPSVMIRKSVLVENNLHYNTNILISNDYALWVEISQYSKLANLPKMLLRYRIHTENVSHVYAQVQKDGASLVRQQQLEKLGLNPSEEDMYIHNSFAPKKQNITDFIGKEESWLTKIIDANAQTQMYSSASLSKIIYTRWRTVCGSNTKGGFSVWRKYHTSLLFKLGGTERYFDSVKIFIKCLIRRQ
ncbi:MAG: glycosyltransferase [Candidatus Kaiserbacteria bacterium]|nr:glycosyltransferase [Candidatus Kaiserbacteria bacterium]